ncbi:MAG: hypothetical protein WAT93_13665 [Pontixanthobacter sp.]
MSRDAPSLGTQAAAVRHIHSIARRSGDAAESILENASWAIRTLETLEKRTDLVALIRIIDAFKGGELTIRSIANPEGEKKS